MTTSATLLIASDIFGMTDAFRRLARSLCRRPVPVSAHADPSLSFIDETEAYARFVEAGGVGAYAARIRRILTERPDISGLVGFSAGASAGWVVSATSESAGLSLCVLFYGSRVRDHAGLVPGCPVRLVFAERERSFDPAPLAAGLAARGVPAEVVPGSGHGFMNELSASYSPELYRRYTGELNTLFARRP
jgi:dienelactone hydrolase